MHPLLASTMVRAVGLVAIAGSNGNGNCCCASSACRGAAPAWHLSHVEVSNHSTGARAVFYANAWLDVKLGTTTLLLNASSTDGQQSTARNKWKLSVQTR
jgi:hypothetical protein